MITFRSRASSDVMMFDDIAKRMMELMGKEPEPRGIVTVDQLPEAIARLKAALAEDKAAHQGEQEEDRPLSESKPGGGSRPYVGLGQRIVPLLELLEWSRKAEEPVMWGM